MDQSELILTSKMLYRLIFLLCLVAAARADDAQSPKIIIVGAGPSGIAAASKLLENGFNNVLILEAEDRIGGRVYTTPFDKYVVDLGAQWIHGEKDNAAYELASPLNLTDHASPDTLDHMKTYMSTGELIDPAIMKNLTIFYLELMEDHAIMSSDECKRSIGKCYVHKLREHFKKLPELNDTMQDQFLWHYNLVQTGYDPADNWTDIASDNSDEYRVSEGDQVINWKERGYGTILDILMKKFPNPEEELPVLNKTILNAEVSKVDYSNEDGTVKVTTSDGKEYTADYVIMTPSLGVLKEKYETMFNPPLPEDKVRNIKGLGFGNACKIFLAFDDPWFNPQGVKNGGHSILWSVDELETLHTDPKTMWMVYALGFYFVEHKPNLMYVWVSGEGARLMDDLTDEEVFQQTKTMLNNLLSKHFNVTEPKAMIRSKWHQNQHFRGTYSFRSLETVNTNSSAKQLSEPIMKNGKPVVLFGGEATHEHKFSTVHGAISTGWREAERIMNLHKKTNDEA
ncbi:spermine oxidase-like [Ceratina calcarata]|uniref:Spermine oxidase-like n=1 Tax=Ceratina calcarata TaxID=156304 RepID=A0AAJ7NDF4_9HYME|nr:spermine oxidase-like [Ceratina calcarata]